MAPLNFDPDSLRINADATDGSIQLELVDLFGRVLAGFRRDQCSPFTAIEVDHRIKWDRTAASNSESSGDKPVRSAPGGVKVKVYPNGARLFALYTDPI